MSTNSIFLSVPSLTWFRMGANNWSVTDGILIFEHSFYITALPYIFFFPFFFIKSLDMYGHCPCWVLFIRSPDTLVSTGSPSHAPRPRHGRAVCLIGSVTQAIHGRGGQGRGTVVRLVAKRVVRCEGAPAVSVPHTVTQKGVMIRVGLEVVGAEGVGGGTVGGERPRRERVMAQGFGRSRHIWQSVPKKNLNWKLKCSSVFSGKQCSLIFSP